MSPIPLRKKQLITLSVFLALALILVLGLSVRNLLPAFAAAANTSTPLSVHQLSTDPYTNSSSQHQTEVEPDTYSYGSTVITAYQAGRFYAGGGSSNIGWATSNNAGTSWKNGFLKHTTVYAHGRYNRISDPSVAYDPLHGAWLIASLGLTNTHGNDVLVSRSTDGGYTWSSPIVIASAGPQNYYLDKEWIVCDTHSASPYYGHCYTQWDNGTLNGRIDMSTSTNGGLTWGTALSPQSQNFFGQGGQPLVQPGGRVIVPIYGQDLTTNLYYMYAYTSNDGGQSWTNPITISQLTYNQQGASYRGGSLPSAEIDGSGKVYMVWDDCRFETNCTAGDIVLTTTTDGVNWSPVQRIPIDPVGSGVDHFTAGIAVDTTTSGATAHLAVTFYYFANTNCNNSTCQLYTGFVSSVNGGASWSAKQQLAGPMMVTWLANTDQGYMTGDYISTSIANQLAVPVFPVAAAPQGTTLHESMYTAVLTVTGGTLRIGHDPVRVVAPTHGPSSRPRPAN